MTISESSSAVAGPDAFTTERYSSQQFQEEERRKLFDRTWIIVARESDVPRAGDSLAIDELGESLLLVRGHEGVLRMFRNTCRHRGTRLVGRRCSGPRVVCPYHGWTYGLDGKLIGVPRSEGFERLDRETLSLFSIRCEAWGGFVWITFDPQLPPVAEYLGELDRQLSPYRLEQMRPLLRWSWTLPCNWKAVLDQATESYHLDSVHGRSVGKVIDTVSTFHELYPHHLQTIPIADFDWRPWLDSMSVPDELSFTSDQLRLFHKYLVFPNAVMNVMPYHLTVFRVFPLGPNRCRFHYEFHVRQRAGVIGRLRGWLTLLASLYILREDFGVLRPFQAGIEAAGNRSILFHREERPLRYFHQVVDDYLRGGPSHRRRTGDSVLNKGGPETG